MTSTARVLPFAIAAISVQLAAQAPERVSVLVHLAPRAGRGPVRAFASSHGASVRYEYTILPDVLNLRNMPVQTLAGLRNIPGVLQVNEDQPVRASLVESTALVRGLKSQVNAAGFYSGGAGKRICIVDTGLDSNHIMYRDRIDTAAGIDLVNDDLDPEDDHGHGAHVAGIAAGAEDLLYEGKPLQGIAYRSTLIGVKVLDAFGYGLTSDVVAGIQHCANASLPGGRADVINMSFGHGAFSGTCDADEAAQASNNAVSAGVVVVAAAGNGGLANALSSPACGSSVISVGATWDKTGFGNAFCLNEDCSETCLDLSVSADKITCFSNRSDQLDVVAPGCSIRSAAADLIFDYDNAVQEFCGTSQAAPHVAGLAAFMLAEHPSLTPAEVRQKIRSGAKDLGTPGFDSTYGHGRIDVINSLGTPADSPPTVSIVNPAEGTTVSGMVPVQISASDAGAAADSLTVAWNADGGGWQPATYNGATGYYEATWSTIGLPNSGHILNARATDSANQTANDANNVTVNNALAASHASNLLTGRYVKSGKGKNATLTFQTATAFVQGDGVVLRVTVTDGSNNPVQNATAVFAISGAEAATLTSGPSNSSGVAEGTWQTKAPNRRGTGGTTPGAYTATVTGVTAAGYQWDNVQVQVTFSLAAK